MALRRTIRSDTIKNALKNFVVPLVADKFFVISLRCLWDVFEEDLDKANYNLVSKQEEIEKILNSTDEIVLYFSCLCAMKSSDMRHKFAKRKRQQEERRQDGSDSDEDYQSYNTDARQTIIPGMV